MLALAALTVAPRATKAAASSRPFPQAQGQGGIFLCGESHRLRRGCGLFCCLLLLEVAHDAVCEIDLSALTVRCRAAAL